MGVREATGRNDGPVVEAIQDSVNMGNGPWCAAFNFYCYLKAALSHLVPKSAWSPDWVRGATWTRARGGQTPKPGDSFGIYFSSKGRVAHTGLVYRWGDTVLCIEGNTGPTGSVGEADRNGDGVYKKRRSPRQIYAVRNWID